MIALLVLSGLVALGSCQGGYQYSPPQARNQINTNYVQHNPQPQIQQSNYNQFDGGYQLQQPQSNQLNTQFRQNSNFDVPISNYATSNIHATQNIGVNSQRYLQTEVSQQVLAPQIHKHVYVHVAPEDPEEIRARANPILAPPQKHYKIIFIKAPTPPTPIAPVLRAQQLNEEKTLVYVLVKKPDEQQDIVLPTQAATPPSKPEVFFIKYKANKEAVNVPSLAPIGNIPQHVGIHQENPKDDTESVVIESARNTQSAGLAPKYGPPGYQR